MAKGVKKNRKSNLEKEAEKLVIDALSSVIMASEREVSSKVTDLSISLPQGVSLGKAIVTALAWSARRNQSVNEDPMTALSHISDKELGDAISQSHKPAYFS